MQISEPFGRRSISDLVPSGEGVVEVDVPALQSRIQWLWQTYFADLDLIRGGTRTRLLFKRLTAASIRYASQVNLWVAKLVIFDFLRHASGHYGPEDFAPDEQRLLELRSACRCLATSIGLPSGCGPLFAELINEYAVAQLDGVSEEARSEAERQLQDHIFLLGELRGRRRPARAVQRKEVRGHRQTGSGTRKSGPEGEAKNWSHLKNELFSTRSGR